MLSNINVIGDTVRKTLCCRPLISKNINGLDGSGAKAFSSLSKLGYARMPDYLGNAEHNCILGEIRPNLSTFPRDRVEYL